MDERTTGGIRAIPFLGPRASGGTNRRPPPFRRWARAQADRFRTPTSGPDPAPPILVHAGVAPSSSSLRLRRPQDTLLWRVVNDRLADFRRLVRESYQKPLPRYVDNEWSAARSGANR